MCNHFYAMIIEGDIKCYRECASDTFQTLCQMQDDQIMSL